MIPCLKNKLSHVVWKIIHFIIRRVLPRLNSPFKWTFRSWLQSVFLNGYKALELEQVQARNNPIGSWFTFRPREDIVNVMFPVFLEEPYFFPTTQTCLILHTLVWTVFSCLCLFKEPISCLSDKITSSAPILVLTLIDTSPSCQGWWSR